MENNTNVIKKIELETLNKKSSFYRDLIIEYALKIEDKPFIQKKYFESKIIMILGILSALLSIFFGFHFLVNSLNNFINPIVSVVISLFLLAINEYFMYFNVKQFCLNWLLKKPDLSNILGTIFIIITSVAMVVLGVPELDYFKKDINTEYVKDTKIANDSITKSFDAKIDLVTKQKNNLINTHSYYGQAKLTPEGISLDSKLSDRIADLELQKEKALQRTNKINDGAFTAKKETINYQLQLSIIISVLIFMFTVGNAFYQSWFIYNSLKDVKNSKFFVEITEEVVPDYIKEIVKKLDQLPKVLNTQPTLIETPIVKVVTDQPILVKEEPATPAVITEDRIAIVEQPKFLRKKENLIKYFKSKKDVPADVLETFMLSVPDLIESELLYANIIKSFKKIETDYIKKKNLT
jgi:hypothetical protein